MKVKDGMTRPVISIEPAMSVQQAAQLMLKRRIVCVDDGDRQPVRRHEECSELAPRQSALSQA
jgi:CBS domain-containing protein